MQELNILKQLYKPVQPTVGQSPGAVTYLEFTPAIPLQPYIHCYWQLATTILLTEPFYYRVVADGCIDIFFDLNKPEENFVMGLCTTYTEFPLENEFNYIGIRFLPTAFPQLFGINAAALTNRFEAADQVIPNVSKFLRERFNNSLSAATITSMLDEYFTGVLSAAVFNADGRLYEAIAIILKHQGTVNIGKELATGISSRQLQKLFTFYVGGTAKSFSRIVRFQQLLHAKPSAENLRRNKLFFDAGYYDQAHFIKEFKTLFGTTPRQAFSLEKM